MFGNNSKRRSFTSQRDELARLLSEDDFSIAEIEEFGMRAILPYIIDANDYDVIIYGTDGKGYDALCWLKSNHIEPLYMVDTDINKHNTCFFGVNVVHVDHLKEEVSGKKVYAIVCSDAWNDFRQRHVIYRKLHAAGCKEIKVYKTNASSYRFWTLYYKSRKQELLQLFDELCDEESKSALYEYIHTVICDVSYAGRAHPTSGKYIASDVFKWRDDECVANCGAYIGDTIYHIVRAKRQFEKIYALESNADKLKRAVELSKYLPIDTQRKLEFYHALLSQKHDRLDDVLNDRKVTLVTTDVEGAEHETLVGAERIIKEQLPVLALSVYHKREDMIEIPNLIRKFSSRYIFLLRKYNPAAAIYSKDEIVLYAVPEFRLHS